jgi:hypothetical protein
MKYLYRIHMGTAVKLLTAAASEAQRCIADMRYANSELASQTETGAELAYQTEIAAQAILQAAIEARRDLSIEKLPMGIRAAQAAYWLARGLSDAFIDGAPVDGAAIAPVLKAATEALSYFAYMAQSDMHAKHYGWRIIEDPDEE